MIVVSTSFSSLFEWSTYMRQVRKDISAESTSTITPLKMPLVLKRMGKLRSAPPSMLFRRARTVVSELFFF